MEYFYRNFITVLYLVYVCKRPVCSQRSIALSLNHNRNVFQVNVKEYLIVDDGNITIKCSTSRPPGDETVVNITLRCDDQLLKQMGPVTERKLTWTGRPMRTSNLSCEMTYNVTGRRSRVAINGIITHNITDKVNCFPQSADSVFLLYEEVELLCVTTGRNFHWNKSMALQLEEDEQIKYSNKSLRVFRNYVELNTLHPYDHMTCISDKKKKSCIVKNLRPERNLSISISPEAFSDDVAVFTCEANLPTEYISWYIETFGNKIIMKVEPWFDIPWQHLITNNRTTSVLAFTDWSAVTGLKSVSCSTSRAGYLASAISTNDSSKGQQNECGNGGDEGKTITMSTGTSAISHEVGDMTDKPVDGSGDIPNIGDMTDKPSYESDDIPNIGDDMTDKPSNESDDIPNIGDDMTDKPSDESGCIPTSDTASIVGAGSSTGLAVTVILLGSMCIILVVTTSFLAFKIQLEHRVVKTTDVHHTVDASVITPLEATDVSDGCDVGANSEERVYDNPSYTTDAEDNDHLSTDILGCGSVVVVNDIYQAF